MDLRPVKYLHFYYIFVILVSIILFVLGFQYYGSVRSDKLSLEFESLVEAENLDKESPIDSIEQLARKDKAKESLVILNNLDGRTAKINETFPSEKYGEFQEESKVIKESLQQLITLPELSSILFVLNTKVNQFRNYAIENKWRSLTRNSRRILKKINPSTFNNPDFFKVRNISKVHTNIRTTLGNMERITSSSRLNPSNKENILSRLSTWKIELKMLEDHIRNLKVFENKMESFRKSYDSWHETTLATSIHRKLNFEKKSDYFSSFSIFFIIFLLGGFGLGIFLYKRVYESIFTISEKNIINIMQKFIVPFDGKISSKYSQSFRIKIGKLKEYLQQRMSYGIIFQEATPFSAILLDSNLNLIWGNDLFYKTWNFKKRDRGESISWDYLQQFTNLGENDPIKTALKNTVAGIYNIQIRAIDSENALPYEMYVSPVQYLGQKKIMLFFYPLRPMEEELNHQVKSLVGPVTRSLDALIESSYTTDFSDRIARDFDIAGISYIHKKFISCHEFVLKEKEELMNEIKKLENELVDAYKFRDDIKDILHTRRRNNQNITSAFSFLKKCVVSSADERVDILNIYEKSFSKLKLVWKEQDRLLSNSLKTATTIRESAQAMNFVIKSKKQFKEAVATIDEFKYVLLQTLDKNLFFKKKEDGDGIPEQNIQRTKHEVKKLDDVLNTLLELTTQFDVSLSKMEMVLKEYNTPDFSHSENVFKENQQMMGNEISSLHLIKGETEISDQKLVDGLRNLYEMFTVEKNHFKAIENLVHSYQKESNATDVDFFSKTSKAIENPMASL